MIFLPNKFERYIAALRNTIQISALKHGIGERQKSALKKIYIAESVLTPYLQPIDLKEYISNLILGVYTRLLSQNRQINPIIKVEGIFLINKKLFDCLILNICSVSDKIKIYTLKEKIIIRCNANVKSLELMIRNINGSYLYELKSNSSIIVISAQRTEKTPNQTEREWEYIENPFSSVNIFL